MKTHCVPSTDHFISPLNFFKGALTPFYYWVPMYILYRLPSPRPFTNGYITQLKFLFIHALSSPGYIAINTTEKYLLFHNLHEGNRQ